MVIGRYDSPIARGSLNVWAAMAVDDGVRENRGTIVRVR